MISVECIRTLFRLYLSETMSAASGEECVVASRWRVRLTHVIVLTLAERKHRALATPHITQTGSPSRRDADVISEKLTQCSRCLHTRFY